MISEEGNEEMLDLFLSCERVKFDEIDSVNGMTPLLVAAENGHAGVVERLLRRKANPT